MLRRISSLIYAIGRATTYVLGLLVLAALLLGPVSIGLAAVGDPLRLGKANDAVDRVTALVSTLAGPVLRLTNQGEGPALDLRVQNNAPPLRVNSTAKVANLNVERLDGMTVTEFVRSGITTYDNLFTGTDQPTPGSTETSARCDDGDLLQSGGYLARSANTRISENLQSNVGAGPSVEQWRIVFSTTDSSPASITVSVRCFDLPPLKSGSAG